MYTHSSCKLIKVTQELLPDFCRRSKELKSDPGSPVPWFARHVEILGDVIIYPVLVVARTEKSSFTINS